MQLRSTLSLFGYTRFIRMLSVYPMGGVRCKGMAIKQVITYPSWFD